MARVRFWQVILIALLLVTLIVLGGVASNVKFTLSLTHEKDVILDKEYTVRFPTYFKIMTRYKGDYMAYYASFDNEFEALEQLNPEIYIDINNAVKDLEKESIPNSLSWDKSGYKINKGENGVIVDRISIYKSVFEKFDKKVQTNVNTYEYKSGPDEEELLSATKKLAQYSTNYSSSTLERKHNIELAAKLIDCTVIKPLESFSFNNIVGERTAERGFKTALVIEKGKFVKGIGGGVCQVSTTLYNAALLSGMEIETVRHHTLPVSYVPLSFDAMVSANSDLVFYNPTDYDIFIRAKTDGNNVSFTFYGKNVYPDKDVVKLRSVTLRQLTDNTYEEILDTQNELKEDENERITEYAKTGYESEGYIEVYRNNKLISSKQIRKDTYLPQKGRKLVRKLPDTNGGRGGVAA